VVNVGVKTFVARQPIFNKAQTVVGYELLFRSGDTENYDASDADDATISVISGAFLSIGLDQLTGKKPAFINFTKNLLRDDIALRLPKRSIVVEILEDVEPDEGLVEVCKKLKSFGYVIALDDFVFRPEFKPLLPLIDIIKVDFLITRGSKRKTVIDQVASPKVRFLAEKVETLADFKQAVKLGYTYFQGYFFSKPVVVSGVTLSSAKVHYLRLLNEMSQPDLDFGRLETIIQHDVAFSFKLLKYINSAAWGFRQPIHSIKQALVLLGEREVVQWASLLTMRELGGNKPDELIALSVTRAKLGELLAPKVGIAARAADIFFMGLFSLIDSLVDRPLAEVLRYLPLASDVKGALLGEDNLLGTILRLILAYEKGEWNDFAILAQRLQLSEAEVPAVYFQALLWADEFIVRI